MKANRVVYISVAVAFFAPLHPLVAQSGTLPKDAVSVTCEEAMGDRIGSPSGAPFTATWKQTDVEKQADGTTYTSVSLVKVARDSDGRTYSEARTLHSGNEVKPLLSFEVFDPVKHIAFVWPWVSPRVLWLHHVPNPDTPEEKERLAKVYQKSPWVKTLWEVPLCISYDPAGDPYVYEGGQFKVEKLATKTILGIPAKGILAARVYPAGYKGYGQQVTVTEERWYSDDLQLVLGNTLDDPRIGKGTLELISLERAEPSPALFQIPAGYTIKEDNPGIAGEPFTAETKPVLR